MVHGIIGKNIPPKEITLGNGEPLGKKMLEEENNKQVRTSTISQLKKKQMLREKKINRHT